MSTFLKFPEPGTLTISAAAKWYRAMVPLIPHIRMHQAYGDDEKELRLNEFKTHWLMKARLRLVAAAAIDDPELADEFLQGFPLPSVNECLGRAFAAAQDARAFEWALSDLLYVSEMEKRRYPATVGESIGLECHTADGVYVMTEQGWAKKE